jgi:spermidine synthase
MSEESTEHAGAPAVSSWAFPFLVLLFVGSGCAALIYEVVWFQLLGLVIGASSVSLGILLGTFMGGMCLGSLLLPRYVSPTHHPLKVYAYLELGIGAIGILVLFGMPLVGSVYTGWAGSDIAGFLLRGLVASICLLPPTMLMGATLPAISRWVKTTPDGVSWLGFFYGANIGGAALGTVLAGFYLLRVYDIVIATFCAVAINIAVAAAGLAVARVATYRPGPSASESEVSADIAEAWPVYLTIGISGMTALSAEVLWTRHLSLLVGATVYGFALILSVFLLGLGIGSSGASALSTRLASPRRALGWCQLALCAAMAWAAYTVTQVLPYWPVDVTLESSAWIRMQMDMVRVLWAMLPAAVLWGASFPLAFAAVAAKGQDPGRLVGGLYAANTLGAIIGSLGTGLVMVALVGSQLTQQLLIVASAAAGLLMLESLGSGANPKLSRSSPVIFTLALAGALLLASSVPRTPGEVVAYGRFLPVRGIGADVIYMGEGLTASVAVTRGAGGILSYHNAGKVQASSNPEDMRLQRMLGHLTTLVPAGNDNFLVIGLGAGVTAGAVSVDPTARNVEIAEIEPLVPSVINEYFGPHNFFVVDNPRVHITIDDGRHFLQTTDMTFDGITSDPLDPWVKGTAALYTREFWTLAKSRLNPGGVVTVFVQLYESTEDAVRSEVATFLDVFPNSAIFANIVGGTGYDMVLLGMADGDRIDVDQAESRLNDPKYAEVRASLAEVGFYSSVDLFATFVGQTSDLEGWLTGAPINVDRNLRLQYLAGMGLNLSQAESIFNNMLAGGVAFPETLFTGSEALVDELRHTIFYRRGR